MLFFFFYCFADHRDLHSFPTRRSSDLMAISKLLGVDLCPRLSHLRDRRLHIPREMAVPTVLEGGDRKSTRLNSSHLGISYAVFCLKKKTKKEMRPCIIYSQQDNEQSRR